MIAPTLVPAGEVVHTLIPLGPTTVQETVPVGAIPPEPVTVAVKVNVDPRPPAPLALPTRTMFPFGAALPTEIVTALEIGRAE